MFFFYLSKEAIFALYETKDYLASNPSRVEHATGRYRPHHLNGGFQGPFNACECGCRIDYLQLSHAVVHVHIGIPVLLHQDKPRLALQEGGGGQT